VRAKLLSAIAVGFALSACAGRDPQPIATVQVQDTYADCTQIRAEIEANNIKMKQLSDEQGGKVAQNVGAGLVGLIIWPVWFGMDFKDAAGKEVAALQARQQYLTTLATERCAPPPRTASPLPPRHGAPKSASQDCNAGACTHKPAAFTVGYWVQERTSPAHFRMSLNDPKPSSAMRRPYQKADLSRHTGYTAAEIAKRPARRPGGSQVSLGNAMR
jgi:hypothetical protein